MKTRTVHEIPPLAYPFYYAISWLVAFSLRLVVLFLRKTCDIQHLGRRALNADEKPYIYCFWHENLPPYFIIAGTYQTPFVWLNHPAWFMKPIHIYLKEMLNVKKIAFGSSGHGGRKALAEVIDDLKEGIYSTALNPDGPYGPIHQVKSGVLEMSLQSGLPVVPMHIHLSSEIRLPTWDKKRFPMPFSTIIVTYGSPVKVTEENYEEVRERLREEM